MEEKIKSLIEKVIFKKYPFLYDVNVEDRFEDIPNLRKMLGLEYVVYIKSEDELSPKKQMEIDTEIKTLFKMLGHKPNKFSINEPSISVFFDSGDGFEFKSTPGYNH